MANGADSVTADAVDYAATETDALVEWNKSLKEWAAQTSLLPIMRPQVYIPLDCFPKNAAGKVDRSRLPSAAEAFELVVSGSCAGARVAPTSDEERKMAGCWERVLRKKDICVETAFVTYGGHSLTALALRSEISKVFSVFLPAALITNENCTVRRLVQ